MVPYALALLAVASTGGCGGGEDPLAAYDRYVSALASARYEDAFDGISAESVAALESLRRTTRPTQGSDRADVAERVAGTPDAFTAFRALVSSGPPAYLPAVTPESVKRAARTLAERDGASAVVVVETPAGPRRVALRRENGLWKVVLDGL